MTAYTDTGLVTHHAAGEAANLSKETIETLLAEYPFIEDFFAENRLTELHISDNTQLTFDAFLQSLSGEQCEEYAIDREALSHSFFEYIIQMKRFLNGDDAQGIQSLTILPGTNKSGEPENFQDLILYPSQIISIVGPTGSGKSRLLADIEWTAQKDTPTGRTILINGEVPDKAIRFSINNKLVAQLSQNMNFVMDLSVREFIELHAESRLVENKETAVQRIIEAANKLAGEQFRLETPITALSGGQSRALMIADTAILSSSPIVLIDEIENAGIDRKKALQLLISNEKIVLMATHDPALALYADKRIVIKNGGIHAVIETSEHEKAILNELESMDAKIQALRVQLRAGERL
ncbi:ATP-binding cassette domain-containing protein [Treponema vincentii]|uniref:ATP-binding cassette domain-containing protein n=1 Tax=Treponema vincentii TaxID=69710 RepID=UPI0035F593F9